jgi:hypothetical protein
LMILLANFAVTNAKSISLPLAFGATILALLFDWLFRIGSRPLATHSLANLSLSLLILVLPIFFAAIAFAEVLKKSGAASKALGYNLFGAMVGGMFEYSSTIWGINSLNLLCIAAYVCAVIACSVRRQTAGRENVRASFAVQN